MVLMDWEYRWREDDLDAFDEVLVGMIIGGGELESRLFVVEVLWIELVVSSLRASFGGLDTEGWMGGVMFTS